MRRYLILIFTTCLVLTLFILVGCQRESSTTSDPSSEIENNETKWEDIDQQSLYSIDLNDLEEKYKKNNQQDITKESELPYQLKVSVDYKDENIIYLLLLENPTNNMNKVYISFMPSLELIDSLYAASLLVTTTNNPNPINLDPLDIKQYEVGGSFFINESKIDQNFESNYQEVLVKVTWVDEKNEEQTRYTYVEAVPSENMKDLLLN